MYIRVPDNSLSSSIAQRKILLPRCTLALISTDGFLSFSAPAVLGLSDDSSLPYAPSPTWIFEVVDYTAAHISIENFYSSLVFCSIPWNFLEKMVRQVANTFTTTPDRSLFFSLVASFYSQTVTVLFVQNFRRLFLVILFSLSGHLLAIWPLIISSPVTIHLIYGLFNAKTRHTADMLLPPIISLL